MEVFKVSLITIIQQEASILEVSFYSVGISLLSPQRPLCVAGGEAGERNNESERGTIRRGIYYRYFYQNPQRGPPRRRECEY